MNKKIEKYLMKVQKPSRYTGGEVNSVYKNPNTIEVRFAFCFPDTYEIGMSCLGMKILYSLLNEIPDVWCERAFAPWPDMQIEMEKHGTKLFALESSDELKKFDILGFTLQYELCYTNVLNMLKLAEIPIFSKDRKNLNHLVVAGGPCTYNPEPMADFVDLFMIGEGEEVLLKVVNLYKEYKKKGATKDEFLHKCACMKGVYIPKLYKVDYNFNGTIQKISPKFDDIPKIIEKCFIKSMDECYYPQKPIIPSIQAVHDRITCEIFRGCKRGCRFCQAGFICRPVREKTSDEINNQCKKIQENTGYDEISLCSLSSSDYSDLQNLIQKLNTWTLEKKINVSLPSQRVDSFSKELSIGLTSIRRSGLTFAPEAGTQRLRDIINKNLTEEMLLKTCMTAFEAGWTRLKLYFMIGLPFETIEDVYGIPELAKKILDLYYKKMKKTKKISITISVSSFIPKPFTPFQWAPQEQINILNEKQDLLKKLTKNRDIKLSWSNSEMSFIEAVFARGDRKLSKALAEAINQGIKFDAWSEHFEFKKWLEIFKKCDINPEFYANRQRKNDEIFPWEHISCGVTKNFFYREYKKAQNIKTTPNCGEMCSACGLQDVCKFAKNHFSKNSKIIK